MSSLAICAVLISACASAPKLTLAATKVRQITAQEAKSCTFLQIAQFTGTLAGMGKSHGLVHQAGENGLRNEVAKLGGNAFIIIQADADWFWGHVNYSGEAYRCS